jgi:hypothetical protein
VLCRCCYADMLSDRFNPLRDDARADAMLALARSKAASPSQRACVAFAKQNIQAVRKREADTAKAREEYMQKVEQDYINYQLEKNKKGKKGKKGGKKGSRPSTK